MNIQLKISEMVNWSDVCITNNSDQCVYELTSDRDSAGSSINIPLNQFMEQKNRLSVTSDCKILTITAITICDLQVPDESKTSYIINSRHQKIFGINKLVPDYPWIFEFELPIFQWLLPKVYPGVLFYHRVD